YRIFGVRWSGAALVLSFFERERKKERKRRPTTALQRSFPSEPHRQCREGEAQLFPRADADAAREDIIITGFDFTEQLPVRTRHHLKNGAAWRRQIRHEEFALLVERVGAGDFEAHQGAKRIVPDTAAQLFGSIPEAAQVFRG